MKISNLKFDLFYLSKYEKEITFQSWWFLAQIDECQISLIFDFLCNNMSDSWVAKFLVCHSGDQGMNLDPRNSIVDCPLTSQYNLLTDVDF